MRRKSISEVLTGNLLLILIIASVAGFALNQYSTSIQDRSRIEIEADQITESLVEVLELPLWNVDKELVIATARYYAENGDVVELRIYDESGEALFNYEDDHHQAFTSRASFIKHKERTIGKVELGLGLHAHKHEEALHQFSHMILVIAVILIASVGSFILTKNITKPLIKLTNNIRNISSLKGSVDKKLLKRGDEIGELAQAFDEMRKKLQQKIQDVNSLMSQKNALFGQLAHDLKTPLVPIVGLLPELLKIEKDPKKRELLEVSASNANRLYELIKKTLTLVHMESGSFKLVIGEVDIVKSIKKVIGNNRLTLEKKGFTIKTKFEKVPFVAADSSYLEEVLENFLTNSRKYSDKKKHITFGVARQGDFVKVFVKDKGKGIARENLKHIFNEFYKEDWSRHEASSGLGLSIAKRVIKAHGGEVFVESDGKGKGSTFGFIVPIWKGDTNEKSMHS